jgi:RNA polymerase sigma-70 factor (ECF subfamily)
MEDAKIVQLYFDRNEAALNETQKKYGKYLHKIANNILYNDEDAEECVNDTYLSAWNAIPPHKPDVLSLFLGKLTRGHAIDQYRKSHAGKRIPSEFTTSIDELEECIPSTSDVEANLEAKRLGEVISSFLREQSDEARNLFVGRYYYADSLKDVAAYYGMTETKAKMILFRTRQKLKEYLETEGFTV